MPRLVLGLILSIGLSLSTLHASAPEHAKTDQYADLIKKELATANPGVDCGIKAVKQEGFSSGSGMFPLPLWDYVEFSSGMRVSTDWLSWNLRYVSFKTLLVGLASTERYLIDSQEQHIEPETGKVSKPIVKPSACLSKYAAQ